MAARPIGFRDVLTSLGCRSHYHGWEPWYLYWTCGPKRARLAEIEMLCRLHTDHFSRSFKGSGLHAQKVTINDARGRDHRSIMGRWTDSVEGGRIDARKFGDSLFHRLRIGGVNKTRSNSCISRGGVRILPNNTCNVERPVGRALRCSVLCRRDLAMTSHPNEDRGEHHP